MHLAAAHGTIGSDGKDGEMDGAVFSDFDKTVKVSAVSAVIHGAARLVANEITAKSAMSIVHGAGTPVLGRREGDFQRPAFHLFPKVHFHDFTESGTPHQPAHAARYKNWLSLTDALE